MLNEDRLPPEAIPVLAQHVDALLRVLGEKLIGVYVHGSAAMGGFNVKKSDLDYLALVDEPLAAVDRTRIAQLLEELFGTSGFAKGVEMSIVEERFAGKDFRYPTPFEFHMGSRREQIALHAKPHEREYVDTDLASHFAVARERGVCVYGKAIVEVFEPIDHAILLRSVYEDFRGASELVQKDPVYVILNLCRTLYLVKEGAILSKVEGARRFLSEARAHRAVVHWALSTYRDETTAPADRDAALNFVSQLMADIGIR